MARFTPEQIAAIAKPHGIAEHVAKDLDATMATVSPNPRWEYHPMGLALVDQEAVRAQYEILMKDLFPYLISETPRSIAYGDDYFIVEAVARFNFGDGETVSYFTVVVTVDDQYVTGERVYNSGPLVEVLDRCFDESFRALPGVVDLSSRS